MLSVSIGLPFMNNAHTIELAVRSVFAQTHSEWELILLDDGASDGSLELVKRISDPRVRVVSDGANRGLAARLNQLTRLSSNGIVVRMDADDAMIPVRLERQAAFLNACPDVDVVGSAVYQMDAREHTYGTLGLEPITSDPRLFFRNAVLPHPSIAARRDWMLANPYDPTFRRSQDKELFVRTHPKSYFAKLEEPLLFYREIGNFRMSAYRATQEADRRIYRRYGPERLGRVQTAWALGRSFVKLGLYQCLCWTGRESLAVSRRGADLSGSESRKATSLIQQIRKTTVPGW